MIKILKKELEKIIENELLSKYTTFRIGGPAKYFFEAKKIDEVVRAVALAKKLNLSFLILGGGSNILFSDEGFNGLVIKMNCKNVFFEKRKGKIIAEAGILLGHLVSESIKNGFSGLESLVGIPGTLGGAIFGNAGLGKGSCCIGDSVERIRLLMPNGKIKEVKKEWAEFSYRYSRLKDFDLNRRPIILSAGLKLKKGDRKELEKTMKEKVELRFGKYPAKPSAGCIFKNLVDSSSALLIDKCGLKGKKIGGAQISKKHANFIINTGGATAQDVLDLINFIKKEVKKKFRIKLEEEIQII